MKIQIFTDGAAKGNPGPGGYGVVLKSGKHYKELSDGFRRTTNNRMELLAVIVGLQQLKTVPDMVEVYSDSKYVVDAIEKGWLYDWVKKNFQKKANPDLWQMILPLLARYRPKFIWIKGHAGHPENERCDVLAVTAAEQKDLKIDLNYENSKALG